MREIVIIRVYFFTPPLLFHSLRTCRDRIVWPIFVFYGSKDVFLWQLRPFWGANKIFFNNFHYFSQKTQNSLFPQCKISIGNNAGSIKDRVVSLRIAGGFRQLRIDWCDRHLCHVTGSDHAHRFGVKQHFWMRVTPLAYKIEQSVMGQKCVSATAIRPFWDASKKF